MHAALWHAPLSTDSTACTTAPAARSAAACVPAENLTEQGIARRGWCRAAGVKGGGGRG